MAGDLRSLAGLLAALVMACLGGAALPGDPGVTRGRSPAPALGVDPEGRLRGGSTDIRFTLNGRPPGPDDAVATEGVRMDGGSPALMVIPTSPQWRHPIGDFPEGLVVRAARMEEDGRMGREQRLAAMPDVHPGLPVLSLAIEPGAFFDADSGIYVPGFAVFDQRADFVRRYPDDQRWWKYPGNYHYRGERAERHGHLSWFGAPGPGPFRIRPDWSADVRLRINGNNTRGFPQHALRVIFPGSLDIPLFGEARGTGFRRVLLRTSGNDQDRTFFRDALQHRLCAGEPFGTSACVQLVLYVNGVYWGLHNLRERLDREEVARRLHVKPKRITLLADRLELYDGEEADRKAFARFLTLAERWDASAHWFRDSLERQMDLDEFLRYMSAQIILGNTDWPDQNGKWYRCRPMAGDTASGCDGRWHFLMGDSDLSFGLSTGPSYDMFAHVDRHMSAPLSRLYRACLRDPLTRERFREVVLAQLEEPLGTARMVAEAERMRDAIDAEMHRHTRRWRRPVDHAAWRRHVESLVRFARERGAHVRRQLDEHFPALQAS